jgi:hypothetical protein
MQGGSGKGLVPHLRPRRGDMAQLVARLYGIQKARSSNLRISTVCVAQGKSAGFPTLIRIYREMQVVQVLPHTPNASLA